MKIGDRVKATHKGIFSSETDILYGTLTCYMIDHIFPYYVVFDEGVTCSCGSESAFFAEDELEVIDE